MRVTDSGQRRVSPAVILLLLFHSFPLQLNVICCTLSVPLSGCGWLRVVVFLNVQTLLAGLNPSFFSQASPLTHQPIAAKPRPISFSCLTFNRFINALLPLARAGHFILLEISIRLSGGGSALYMLMRR